MYLKDTDKACISANTHTGASAGLRFLLLYTGANAGLQFLLSQIKNMSFVEDVNNLLNSGEVPNMFPYDERSAIGETVSVGHPRGLY